MPARLKRIEELARAAGWDAAIDNINRPLELRK